MSVGKKIITIFLASILFLCIFSFQAFAQEENIERNIQPPKEETLEAVVTDILEEKEIEVNDRKQLYQKLELQVTKGSLKDKQITIENGALSVTNLQKYKIGDKLMVNYIKDAQGNDSYFITDYIRRESLLWLFVIFVALTIVIGKWRGLTSILGMGVSFLVIFMFILPGISSGFDPIFVAIAGALIMIPVTFYLSHGFNKKTTIAIFATLIALSITGFLAGFFVEDARLTGFVSEETGFLQFAKQGTINIKGLLLAGIIIGVLGVLDDVTVSQAAVVEQLKEANPNLKNWELYSMAMKVGQDHISSMVNTLVLVYAGASLPLLLLFIDNPRPATDVINHEIIANEIVRTLVGSIGLVLAIPITTLIASVVAKARTKIVSA